MWCAAQMARGVLSCYTNVRAAPPIAARARQPTEEEGIALAASGWEDTCEHNNATNNNQFGIVSGGYKKCDASILHGPGQSAPAHLRHHSGPRPLPSLVQRHPSS